MDNQKGDLARKTGSIPKKQNMNTVEVTFELNVGGTRQAVAGFGNAVAIRQTPCGPGTLSEGDLDIHEESGCEEEDDAQRKC